MPSTIFPQVLLGRSCTKTVNTGQYDEHADLSICYNQLGECLSVTWVDSEQLL